MLAEADALVDAELRHWYFAEAEADVDADSDALVAC